MSQVESLRLSSPPLLCHLHHPAPLCSSSCPWAQVGKSLKEAETLGSHHRHRHILADLTHDHTKLSIPCFPTHAAGLVAIYPCFSKLSATLVEDIREITIGANN